MIRYIKLVSGAEIIGEEVEYNGQSYTLRKPMVIEMIDHGGHVMCSLITYCIATDVVEFNARYVMQTGSASDSFSETYTRRSQLSGEPMQQSYDDSSEPLYEGEMDIEDDEDPGIGDLLEVGKPTYH